MLFVKKFSHFDDLKGGGGKESENFYEVICERPLIYVKSSSKLWPKFWEQKYILREIKTNNMENMQTYMSLEFQVILLSGIHVITVSSYQLSLAVYSACVLSGAFACVTPYHNSLNNDSSTQV